MLRAVTFFTILPLLTLLAIPGMFAVAVAGGFQAGLSAAERALASELALPDRRAIQRPSGDTHLPAQILLVDIKQQKLPADAGRKQISRLAEVFTYDYAQEQTRYQLVDLTLRRVVQVLTLLTHHLPLNAAERQFAWDRVNQNAAVTRSIESELQQLPDSNQASAEPHAQLTSKIAIFEPLSAASPCADRRCAQLTFTTAQRYSLSIEPVVILATGEVLRDGNRQ